MRWRGCAGRCCCFDGVQRQCRKRDERDATRLQASRTRIWNELTNGVGERRPKLFAQNVPPLEQSIFHCRYSGLELLCDHGDGFAFVVVKKTPPRARPKVVR